MSAHYDAVLVLSFGGPEKRDDVLPFLRHVLHGKNVSEERLHQVARHYEYFDGVSPINAQNRSLIAALEKELGMHGPRLPIYFGNRNWHPLLKDTIKQMDSEGVRRALVFVTSAFGSYSSCRQYLDDLERSRKQTGLNAMQLDKLRLFYNHPGFIEPVTECVKEALDSLTAPAREKSEIVFAAHSIPLAMAETSLYVQQLKEACALVGKRVGRRNWTLVYQSRSGPPSQPWLEPDVCDQLRRIKANGVADDVVVIPIGFISDHMEVIYDLDTEAKRLSDQLGLNMIRAATVGTHPRFITMIRQLIIERVETAPSRLALGTLGPSPDVCPKNCCIRQSTF